MRAISIAPLGIAAAYAILTALQACGGPPQSASQAQRVLNIYNWSEYIGAHTIRDFERQTHIKVVYELLDSNESLEGKVLSGHSGYDLVNTPTNFYGPQIKAGAYRPVDRAQLPNWKYLDPAVTAVQQGVDPENRYAVPYLHAMNGIAYNVDLVKARVPNAPLDRLALIFDPVVMAKLAPCGVTFLDSPGDVIQFALSYLHLDPNSQKPGDLDAAVKVIMAVRPFIRNFDSNRYWHDLTSNDICVAVAWSSDYLLARRRAREDGTGAHLAFILPKEGSNITYNAWLIPADATHLAEAHEFMNFMLDPKVIAAVTNEIYYGNDNLAAKAFVRRDILDDPAVYPPPELHARLYLPLPVDPQYARSRTRAWTRIKTGQ